MTIAAPARGEQTITAKAREVIEILHSQRRETELNMNSDPLTCWEILVARLISEGLSNKEIAVKYLKSLPEWDCKMK